MANTKRVRRSTEQHDWPFPSVSYDCESARVGLVVKSAEADQVDVERQLRYLRETFAGGNE